MHAAFSFARKHPGTFGKWYDTSSYLVLLGVQDEAELWHWAEKLFDQGNKLAMWREPDMDNELTAIAIAPSPVVERTVSPLPLLLREAAMV